MQIPKRKPGKYAQLPQDPYMSQEKYDQLQHDLTRLKTRQKGAAAEVTRLAAMGDFSENAEYQHAKGRLRGILSAITKIEHQLSNAVVVEKETGSHTVVLGSRVMVLRDSKKRTYKILGSSETDPAKGIISHTSPIGAALMGKKKGERVEVEIGEGKVLLEIVEIG